MQALINTTTQGNLSEVIKAFENWRATRKHVGPIPESLWVLAKSLQASHTVSEIANALRLNHSQLKNKLTTTSLEIKKPPVTLIECSLNSPLSAHPSQGASLMFSCIKGNTVTMSGLHGSNITAAISALMGV